MNISLSNRHVVHVSHVNAHTGEQTGYPECGGNRGSERYRPTTREVTCKSCLKWLADQAEAEAAYQERLAASMAPATEGHGYGWYAEDHEAAEAEQPAEIREVRETAEQHAAAMQAEVDDMRARMERRIDQVKARGNALHRATAELGYAMSVIDRLRGELSVSTAELREARDDNRNARDELGEAREEIARLRAEVAEGKVWQQRYRSSVETYRDVTGEIARLKTMLTDSRWHVDRLRNDLTTARAAHQKELARVADTMARLRCDDCGGEGGGGSMDPDVYIDCNRCNGTGIDTAKNRNTP